MIDQLDLIIVDKLRCPGERAREVLNEIQEDLDSYSLQGVTLGGLFVLAYSQVEGAVADTYEYYLCSNPWKLELDRIQVSRDELFEFAFTRDLLKRHIQDRVKRLTYEPIERFIEKFSNTLALDSNRIRECGPTLKKLSTRRNEIVHGSPLPVQSKTTSEPPKWPDNAEISDAISKCSDTILTIENEINRVYRSHTYLAALRNIWAHLFNSPIMRFDDFWVIDTSSDAVVAVKANIPPKHISSSERMIFGLWLAAFNGDVSALRDFDVGRLDSRRQQDLVNLLAILRDIRVDGHPTLMKWG
jgi:hypothetical protein